MTNTPKHGERNASGPEPDNNQLSRRNILLAGTSLAAASALGTADVKTAQTT
jgi:hypothetical protein